MPTDYPTYPTPMEQIATLLEELFEAKNCAVVAVAQP